MREECQCLLTTNHLRTAHMTFPCWVQVTTLAVRPFLICLHGNRFFNALCVGEVTPHNVHTCMAGMSQHPNSPKPWLPLSYDPGCHFSRPVFVASAPTTLCTTPIPASQPTHHHQTQPSSYTPPSNPTPSTARHARTPQQPDATTTAIATPQLWLKGLWHPLLTPGSSLGPISVPAAAPAGRLSRDSGAGNTVTPNDILLGGRDSNDGRETALPGALLLTGANMGG